jgi:hypothetical protein
VTDGHGVPQFFWQAKFKNVNNLRLIVPRIDYTKLTPDGNGRVGALAVQQS